MLSLNIRGPLNGDMHSIGKQIPNATVSKYSPITEQVWYATRMNVQLELAFTSVRVLMNIDRDHNIKPAHIQF